VPPMSVGEIKEQDYFEDRPPDVFDRWHARARRAGPGYAMEVVRYVSWPILKLLFRFRALGLEHVPPGGPVILAPNHASFADHFLVAVPMSRRVNYMAKSQLFKGVLAYLISLMGAFPIRRGPGGLDEEAFRTARAVLDRGGILVVYPQAGRARGDEFGGPARPGIGRIALERGATVVPVAIVGSARIREWRRGRFPRITLVCGEPVQVPAEPDAPRARQQEIADTVLARSRALYDAVRR
jgi:1-acyl-sn-glycerol-3-phosphate acyltransferase